MGTEPRCHACVERCNDLLSALRTAWLPRDEESVRRRDRPLVVEGRGDPRSHHLIEPTVLHALAEVLAEVLGGHPRGSRALTLWNERDLHRARTRAQPRPSRVAVVEPRRHHRHVRMHVAELVAARRHLPHERVRHVAPQLRLEVQVQPAPAERYLFAVAPQVPAVLDGERDEMDDRCLVLIPPPPTAHLIEARTERVGESARHPAAALRSTVAAEPPASAPEQRRLSLPRAPALHDRPTAAAAVELAPERSDQRRGPVRRVPGLRASAWHRRQARGARLPVVHVLRLQRDSQ